ncbi:peptidylprolyl isomerase [Pseudoalteromonas pernae]|uniref:peptidylprolyl isomerase n=1 Tax=Pseudoalteromonas pernae TaxID=3118054 RepID=UPI003241C9B0
MKPTIAAGIIATMAAAYSSFADATIVEFQTSQGSFQVNLFDQKTPNTVDNFLGYVDRGDYRSSYIHRSVSNFIVQGGAYTFDDQSEIIATQSPVVNEPVYSNVAGTIAMAKRSGDKNSATSQWFFNVGDNSANLDLQNGGFTVFGQVIGDGLEIVKKINSMDTCNDVPVTNYTADECRQGATLTSANLMMINDIVIIDSDPNSAIDLSPVENTLIADSETDSSSGAAWWLAPLALLVALRRKSAKALN